MLVFAGLEVYPKKLAAPEQMSGSSSGRNKVKDIFAVRRELRVQCVIRRRELPFALLIMEHNCALCETYRGDQRPPVRSHGNSLLRRRTGSQLFRCADGKPLPPEVKVAAGVGAKVHPGSIRRPSHIRASSA